MERKTPIYIDLARDLSLVNRRLYRAGKVYGIAGITVHDNVIAGTGDTFVKACTAPNTWVVAEAWKRGKRCWDEMNRLVHDCDPSNAGKQWRKSTWHDYKVRLIDDARSDTDAPGGGTQTIPVDCGDNAADDGEWVYSEYITPDGMAGTQDTFVAHLLGPHDGPAGNRDSIGLVLSYGESRPTIGNIGGDSPQMDSDGDDDPLINLFDAGTQVDEIAQNLDSYGDMPPYGLGTADSNIGEFYPGSTNNMPKPVVQGETHVTTENSIGYIGPFQAVCGLLEIETKSSPGNTIELVIELMQGNYKGVAAVAI